MDNNFKISPEFLMDMMFNAQKNNAKNSNPQNSDVDTQTQLEYTLKYIEKAFEHFDCFSLSELIMVMETIEKLGNVAKQICKNHNWCIEND